jgi:RNA polymerase sigma-70 factor (ECF subfamily)
MASGEHSGDWSSTGTSRTLLERAKRLEPAAWDKLVTRYAALVQYWCKSRGLAPEDTADVFQEVFRAVATHLASFRKAALGDSFRGWLKKVTINKIHDQYRRSARQPAAEGGTDALRRLQEWPEPPQGEPATTNLGELAAERLVLRHCLDEIRAEFEPKTWSAFWRTAVDGLTAADAGAELAMTAGAVRVAKSRVLARLRAELGESGSCATS